MNYGKQARQPVVQIEEERREGTDTRAHDILCTRRCAFHNYTDTTIVQRISF